MTALWLGTVTLTMQFWVGQSTIYSASNANKVAIAHERILTNTPPDGGWGSMGMNGVNIRVGAVYLGEAVHRLSGWSVLRSYFVIDTVMLWVALILLLSYLRRFTAPVYAVLGVSFVCAVLPLTYQLFWQHPWDRLSLVAWILIIGLLERERILMAALLLPLAVIVKYDIMLLPGLIGLHSLIRDRRIVIAPWAASLGLLSLGIGTYALLRTVLPGGFAPAPVGPQVLSNLAEIRRLNVHWPPFLGFTLPIAFAFLGMRRATPWVQASAVFGLLLFVPFALQSNLAEFRAHLPVLVLILPAAMHGVRELLEAPSEDSTGTPPERRPR